MHRNFQEKQMTLFIMITHDNRDFVLSINIYDITIGYQPINLILSPRTLNFEEV